jgi:hypothetical protein
LHDYRASLFIRISLNIGPPILEFSFIGSSGGRRGLLGSEGQRIMACGCFQRFIIDTTRRGENE